MKFLKAFAVIILFIFSITCYSQKLTIGFLNGVGSSDIHGNQTYGKWKLNNGPVTGIFFNYSSGNSLSLQTELNRTTIYYELKTYNYSIPWYDYTLFSSYYPVFYPGNKSWNYSFYRLPIMVKFKTKSRLKFELSAGFYLSYCYKNGYTGYSVYNDPPKYDNGFIYSASLSYPIANNINIFVDGRYTAGRKVFIEEINGKNGTAEMIFGIGYSFNRKSGSKFMTKTDTVKRNGVIITYKTGINGSLNNGEHLNNSYSPKLGLSGGITLDFMMNPNMAFSTGFIFEQKGYRMKDSSGYRFIYSPMNSPYQTNYNNCTVGFDYLIIPITLKIKFGKKLNYFVNGGIFSGLRLNARVTGNSITNNINESSSSFTEYKIYDDIEGYTKDDDWGWLFGAGALIPVYSKYLIEVGLNYSSSWKNVLDFNDYQLSPKGDGSIKNKSLNITIGLQIPWN